MRLLVVTLAALTATLSSPAAARVADPPPAPGRPAAHSIEPREGDDPAIKSSLASASDFDAYPLTGSDIPTRLAELIIGTRGQITNASYTGAAAAAGTFVGGADVIGIPEGLVLSTGNVTSVVGPNESDAISTGHLTAGDTLLSGLVGATTYDAAVLQFDFTPDRSRMMAFNYVFASDEYNEYANDIYDDVFALHVNGVNIATLPDRSTIVSVNSVNGGNPPPTDAQRPQFYINNERGSSEDLLDTEMDGLTVVMQAPFFAFAGQTYELRLAIADTGDLALDSNIFVANALDVPRRLTPTVFAEGIRDFDSTEPNGLEEFKDWMVDAFPDLDGLTGNPTLVEVPAGTVEENRKRLEEFVPEFLAEIGPQALGYGRVNFVSHSFGGLGARAFASLHPSRVASIYMVGTPNGGNWHAALLIRGLPLAWFTIAQDLHPERVDELNRTVLRDHRGVRYVTIAGSGYGTLGSAGFEDGDGYVTVRSAEHLRKDHPDHLGLHETRPHVTRNHHYLVHAIDDEAPATFPLVLRELYPQAGPVSATTSLGAEPSQSSSLSQTPTVFSAPIVREIDPEDDTVVDLDWEGLAGGTVHVISAFPELSVEADLEEVPCRSAIAFYECTAELDSSVETVTVANLGEDPITVAVSLELESDRYLTVTPAVSHPEVEQQVSILVELTEASIEDEPELIVIDPDGIEHPVSLSLVSAGTWTGSFTPEDPGLHSILAAVGPAGPRQGHAWLTVSSGGIEIGTSFTEALVGDEDGFADALVLTVPVTSSVSGDYFVKGVLEDGDGNLVASDVIIAEIASGAQTVDLTFSADEIALGSTPGPYDLAAVYISAATDPIYLETVGLDLGQTEAYAITDFEHKAVHLDPWSLRDAGIDDDEDESFESLRIDAEVLVTEAGDYGIFAVLEGPAGEPVADAHQIAELETGRNAVAIEFGGGSILASGIDGPYRIVELIVYSIDDAAVADALADWYWTADYAASDFEPSWTSPVLVNDEVQGSQYQPDVALDSDGIGHAVFFDNPVGIVASSWDGLSGTWSAPVKVNDGSQLVARPAIAVDGDGDLYVVWQDFRNDTEPEPVASDIYFSRRPASTGTWTTDVIVNDGTPGDGIHATPDVAVNAAGLAVAVWHDADAGEILSARLTSGTTWSATMVVSATPAAEFPWPQVAVADDGTAFAVWVEDDDRIAIAELGPTDSGWSSPETVAAATLDQRHPALAVDADDNPYVIWTEPYSEPEIPFFSEPGPPLVRMSGRLYDRLEEEWTAVEEILVSDLVTEPLLDWYLGPRVAAETDGSILVAWMRYIEDDPGPERPITILVSGRDPTSGSWSEPEAVTTLSVYWEGYPSPYGGLALAARGGEAMIAYTSFNEPDEFDIRATRRW